MNPSQNNSFGSFGNNSGDFGGAGQSIVSSGDSSGTGLVMSRKRGGKKWLIVVGVVLTLLVVGLLVGMAMRRGENRANYSGALKEYLGILVSGDIRGDIFESDFSIEAVSIKSGNNIYRMTHFKDPQSDEVISYYNDLKNKLSALIDLSGGVEKMSEEQKNEANYLLQDSEQVLPILFVASALAYSDVLYDYYMSNETLDGVLSQYGYPFEDSEDVLYQNIQLNMEEYVSNRKSYYDIINNMGCIVDGGIDYGCVSNNVSSEIESLRQRGDELEYALNIQSEDLLEIILVDAKRLFNMKVSSNA